MAKPFYVDYVNHMLRFYTRHDGNLKQYNSHQYDVEKLNYHAVDSVFNRLTDRDKELITEIFIKDDPINYTLESLNLKLCITCDEAWKIISRVTRLIAKERKLI